MTTNELSAEQLGELRTKLEQERDRLRQRLGDLDQEEESLVTYEALESGEGGIGSGMADAVASLTQRQTDMAAEEVLQQHLEEIEAALARMEAGTYGTCVTCGRPIRIERLRAVPWANQCIDCAGKK